MRNILPFEIPEVGYFPADVMAFSILSAYQNTDAILYGFYNMFGNFCYQENGNITLNAEWNWECPLLCRKLIPRVILGCWENRHLYNFIISCIDAGFYVYISLDQSKIKCCRGYGGSFFPHPMAIYGYDDNEKELYMADFTDGVKYSKGKMAYEEFTAADNSIQEYMKTLNPQTGSNEWILDIELVKYLKEYNMIYDLDYIGYQMKLFLEGRGLQGNRNSIHKRRQPQLALNADMSARFYEAEISNEFYGINVLKEIVIHLRNCLKDSKYTYNFRHIYLVWAYMKLLITKVDKLSYVFEKKEREEFKKILSELQIQEKNLNISIKLALKYRVSTKQEILERVIGIIENAILQIEGTYKFVTGMLQLQ